jgi:hypothetical protein
VVSAATVEITFDLGHAAHDKHPRSSAAARTSSHVDAENWLTKAAQAKRDEIPRARRRPGGTPEASLFWTDERTGIHRAPASTGCPHRTGRRTIIADLKTTRIAEKDKFARPP